MNKRQRRKSDRYSIYTTFEGIPDPTAGAAISHACVTDIGWEQRLQENWR